MPTSEVIAVLGSCSPERARVARLFAAQLHRTLISERYITFGAKTSVQHDPLRSAAEQALWAASAGGSVIEFPTPVNPIDVIGTLTDPASRTTLTAVLTVVDAMDLTRDLWRDDYLAPFAPFADEHTAAALVTALQVELASHILIVNWHELSTNACSQLLALLSAMAPTAAISLAPDDGPVPDWDFTTDIPYRAEQERAGWSLLLSDRPEDDFRPLFRDPRIQAFRYEQYRPLHPGRLKHVLDARIGTGEFGRVVRSAGFCRFATRAEFTGAWEHVGQMIAFAPTRRDLDADPQDELLAIGQDLAFIGVNLQIEELRAALDSAALTDAELEAGPSLWQRFSDPFPAWESARLDATD